MCGPVGRKKRLVVHPLLLYPVAEITMIKNIYSLHGLCIIKNVLQLTGALTVKMLFAVYTRG